MAVFRVERKTGYTVMSNHHLRNKELTLKANVINLRRLSIFWNCMGISMICVFSDDRRSGQGARGLRPLRGELPYAHTNVLVFVRKRSKAFPQPFS